MYHCIYCKLYNNSHSNNSNSNNSNSIVVIVIIVIVIMTKEMIIQLAEYVLIWIDVYGLMYM